MMKKLLYAFALALFVTSCSVDPINEEFSAFESDVNTRSLKAEDICASANLINEKGQFRGTVDAYIDWKSKDVVLKFTTVDWKIKQSKVFFGPESAMNTAQPGLFTMGKYTYTESFKEGVYIANYAFDLGNVSSDFSLMAALNIKNDYEGETIMIDGPTAPGGKLTFAKEFVKFCLEKP